MTRVQGNGYYVKCIIYFNDTWSGNMVQEQNYTEAKSEMSSFGENQNGSGDTEHKVKEAVC